MQARAVVAAVVVGGCLALFVWRELAAMRADGVTLDEPVHLAYGERGLREGTFERGRALFNSKMPVSVLNALPVVVAERMAGPLDPERRLWLARLPTVVLGVALGWLVFHWAAALWGFRGGALALWLYSCCPNVVAHSHLVTTDVATALGMFGATYAFWRYRQQPGPGRLTLAAAAFGAAQLTKATAIFLLPILLLSELAEWGRRRLAGGGGAAVLAAQHDSGRRRLTGLLPAAALTAGALLAINLGFAGENTLQPLSRYEPVSRVWKALAALPLVREVPIPLPQPYLQGLDMVERDSHTQTPIYLHGRYGRRGFPEYFLVAAAIKVPLGTLALLGLAVWVWAAGRRRAPEAEAFLIVPVVFLLAYVSLALELQIGLRFLLPAFPFVFVFIGRVAAAVPPAASPRALLVGLLAVWTGVSSWTVHPRYIPYFNELIGGQRHGYRWIADSNLDWGQDGAYMHRDFARHSPVRVWFDPTGPIAGRVAVGLSSLVEDPRNAWLRDHFEPSAIIHGSWAVFDLGVAGIERCCAGLPHAWALPDAGDDLPMDGQPIGGGDGLEVRLLGRLNDGMLGANTERDAARSALSPVPVRAWFGIAWELPREVGRVVAYPGFWSRGPAWNRFLALDYVWQWWDGGRWLDLPGTRVIANQLPRIEHRFPPVRTTRLRLLIERERNDRGTEVAPGAFRAACLELAAYSN